MTSRDHRIRVSGKVLHARDWLPDSPPRAAVALVHGQGDCIDRYESSLAPFLTQEGIALTGIDFPGHGRSPGRRGDIPGRDFALATITQSHRHAVSLAAGAPCGIFAHSMGALLVIDWFASRPSPPPAFLWLSSPLLAPSHRQSPRKLALARFLARFAPWCILDSGVRSSDCRNPDAPSHVTLSPATDSLHSRIRVGWALDLLEIARQLPTRAASLPVDLPVLLTQGSSDPICPARFAEDFFTLLPCRPKTLLTFPAGLHELFDDSPRDAFLSAGKSWIEGILKPP